LDEKTERALYLTLSTFFGSLDLVILWRVFTAYPSERAVGERFIVEELTFPTLLYTFHFKPITLFIIFGFLWCALGLEGWKRYVERIPHAGRRLIFIFFSTGAFIMFYEFIQNFLMWTSFYILYGGDLDQLYHQVNPAMPQPVNFNFVSKLFAMLLVGALYGMYFLHRIENED